MANNGVLPKSLDDFPFPVCKYCLYGKARSINEYKAIASVGDCVYINVLVSSTTGLIVQMDRFFTDACVFVDHRYDFTYLHILKSQTGYEAVEPKEDLKAYMESYDV